MNLLKKILSKFSSTHERNNSLSGLSLVDFLQMFDKAMKTDGKYLFGVVYGYLLGVKDATSQSYFMSGDKEVAEKVAHIPFDDIIDQMQKFFINTVKDNYSIPVFEVFRNFISIFSFQGNDDGSFRMMTLGNLCEHYVKLEDDIIRGIIVGYVHASKDWMILYMQLDLNTQVKINKVHNIDDIKDYIWKKADTLHDFSEYIAQPIIVNSICDIIKIH